MIKQTTHYFLFFITLLLLFISCEKFEEVPTVFPVQLTKFNLTLNEGTDLSCQSIPYIRDVVEVPNEGYVIAGHCGFSPSTGMVIKLDLEGNKICDQDGYTVKTRGNMFWGLARNNNGEILLTGYADDVQFNTGASGFNMMLSGDCSSGNTDLFDSSNGNTHPPDRWDNSNKVIANPTDNSFVIAGKWEAYPSLIKFNANMIGSDDIIEKLVLDTDFFQQQGISIVPPLPVSGQPYVTPSHDMIDVIKTSDNAFLGIGWVDVIDPNDNTKSIRKAMLVKTQANTFQVDWVRIYSKDEFPTVFTRRNSRGWSLVEIQSHYVLVGDSFDQEIPIDNPNFIVGEDLNGFILHVSKNSGNAVAYVELNDGGVDNGEDRILTVAKKHNSTDSYIVSGKNQTANFTQQGFVREYFVDGTGNIVQGDINVNNIGDAGVETICYKIIATSDGGYLALFNVKDGNSFPEVKVIKMDEQGRFQ